MDEKSQEREENDQSQNVENDEAGPTKNRRLDDKNRKKDLKIITQQLKTLENDEVKFTWLLNKCLSLMAEKRNTYATFKEAERKLIAIQKDNETLENEKKRQILVNSRLESLCRELQKQNKVIKEESAARIREEEEKRKTVSNKFQTTLNQANLLMQQTSDNSVKLREDNRNLSAKFTNCLTQIGQCEEQIRTVVKTKELEQQLSQATIQQLQKQILLNDEMFKKEREALQAELALTKVQNNELDKSCGALRTQIDLYKDKYEEFHTALTKSNDVYGTFKTEMDNLTKKMMKVEKESASWRKKCNKSNTSLIQVCNENARLEAEIARSIKQTEQLKTLCRAMQSERQSLYKTLEKCGVSSPGFKMPKFDDAQKTISVAPQAQMEEIFKTVNIDLGEDSLDRKQKKLDEMKANLSALKGQLNDAEQAEANTRAMISDAAVEDGISNNLSVVSLDEGVTKETSELIEKNRKPQVDECVGIEEITDMKKINDATKKETVALEA